jgi:hypothetical protein
MIAIAIGAAVVAAIIMFVVMRDDQPAPAVAILTDAATSDAALAADASVPADAEAVVVIVDAAIAPVDAAAKPTRSDAGPKPEKPPVEPEPPEDANLSEFLKVAESALARGAADAAKQGANKVIDKAEPDSKPRASKRQLARAYGIRGSASCKTADQSDITSDLGALTRLIRRNPAFMVFRLRMLAYCHANNQLLEIKK